MTFEQVSIGSRIAYTNLFFLSNFAYLIYKGVNHMTKIDKLKKLFVVRENEQGHKELVELLDCTNIGKAGGDTSPTGDNGGEVAQYAHVSDIVKYKVRVNPELVVHDRLKNPIHDDGSVGILTVNTFTGLALLNYRVKSGDEWTDDYKVPDGTTILIIDEEPFEGTKPAGYSIKLSADTEGILYTNHQITNYLVFLNLIENNGKLSVKVKAVDQDARDALNNSSVSLFTNSLLDLVAPIPFMVYFEKK